MRRKPLAATSTVVLAAALAVGAPGTAHADDIRDNQWYLNSFDIDKIHQLSQGAGVRIGVIDSGIDPDHQDLEGNIQPGTELVEEGAEDGDGLTDTFGHGTAVATTIAGHGHGSDNADGIMGIAPQATVIPVRIDDDKLDLEDSSDNISVALQWLVDQGVDIISISSGATSTNEGRDAIKEAGEKGIPIVAAAGNLEKDKYNGDIDDVTAWPAREPGVIPVSGITQDSTYWDKSTTLEDAALSPQLGLSAPAVDIPIALPDNKYDTVNGTSFSAPIVAGTLALIKSAYPDLDYYQWTDRLLDTVDDKGDKGFDNKYGWGIVNPYKALTEETVYEGTDGDQVSSPDDRLPLDEQGKDTGGDEKDDATPGDDTTTGEDSAAELEPDNGIPTWAIITTAAAILTIAAITLILTIRSRKKNTAPHQPAGTGTFPQAPAPPSDQPPVPNGQMVPPGQQPPHQPTGTTQPPGPGQPHQPGPPPDQNPYLNPPPT